jgi:hypothetical protein
MSHRISRGSAEWGQEDSCSSEDTSSLRVPSSVVTRQSGQLSENRQSLWDPLGTFPSSAPFIKPSFVLGSQPRWLLNCCFFSFSLKPVPEPDSAGSQPTSCIISSDRNFRKMFYIAHQHGGSPVPPGKFQSSKAPYVELKSSELKSELNCRL